MIPRAFRPVLLAVMLLSLSNVQAVDDAAEAPGRSGWLLEDFRFPHGVIGSEYRARLGAWAVGGIEEPVPGFAKVSGPDWLQLARDGTVSGTPGPADAGDHAFVVGLDGMAGEGSPTATLRIRVFPQGKERVTTLRVMTYNVWQRWGRVNDGWRKGIDSIVLSRADVIGFQEADPDFARRVAAALGWHVAPDISGSPQIISRYPITDSMMAGVAGGARLRLTESPRREILLFSCHLDHQRYGPYAARIEGATPVSVLAEEARSERQAQIGGILEGMAPHLANEAENPVFLLGDFNTPSHLDWVEAAKGMNHGFGPVCWPVSAVVAAAGLTDSFRALHPNPVADPGDTWSPIFKGTEPQDRIDRIYHSGGGVRAAAAEVFTTTVETTTGSHGSPAGDVAGNTWPSDHAAVLVDFEIGDDGDVNKP